MSETPFTVIDGVPRKILAEALKLAAQRYVTEAKAKLESEAKALATYCQFPEGQSNGLPTKERLDGFLDRVVEARDAYIEVKKTADTVWNQGSDMEQEEFPT